MNDALKQQGMEGSPSLWVMPGRLEIISGLAFWPALLLAVSLAGIYWVTLAPGLTWANGGSDGGDLITAAATGGIPHPTGYPLYLILARLFQDLPVGTLAFRTNLMSAVFSVFAALLIYRLVVRHLASLPAVPAVLAGLAAAYSFGLSPLVWSQAVITEVYALQAFLLTWIFLVYAGPYPNSRSARSMDGWRGLSLGLGLGNHITTLLLIPAALLVGSTRRTAGDTNDPYRPGWLHGYRFDLASLGRQVLWLGAGLSLYLTLPVRASAHPPVSWGNPLSIGDFSWLVSAQLYRGDLLPIGTAHLWNQLPGWIDFSITQVGFLGLLLALLGLLFMGSLSRLIVLTICAALTSIIFASLYRPADAQVYLIPLLISCSIWLGLGSGRLVHLLLGRSYKIGLAVGILILGAILIRPVSYIRQVDASQDQRAEVFGQQVLASAPQGAILFAEGDRALFTLWYYHFALQARPDLIVISAELLPYEWYQETLRSSYLSLSLPESQLYAETLIRANPQRAICHVRYSDDTELQCTSPMVDVQ